MSQDHQDARLNKLEMLFAEQEYTIETLNAIVTRQGDELRLLTRHLESYKAQLNELKDRLPPGEFADEKPPHY